MVRWVFSSLIPFTCEPPPFSFRRERPDFNCAKRCSRTSRSPFEGGVNGRYFQDNESSQLLLGIRVWAILHAALSFSKTHCCCCFGHLKCVGTDVDVGLDERLIVSPPGAQMSVVILVFPHGKLFRRMIDQQSKLHQFSPLAQLSSAVGLYRPPIHMTGENRSIRQISVEE